ncbi:conserved hypothetical protein [Histoplasma mississippiense (nom. inval.)]|uniref:conserved hypothetical protein n=1 Tax=Ajellomyces capsulatus (strain NAm1 / WU24) TaxID=2059318 RepID=UPI000157CE2B|nr:conserved hypothetical protein [Histoplasma mississippiense (nom. inval.)]EDN10433.1 conserved hypothetical protein [Histoplasma mississippiense (nom. inval.)]
MAPAFDFIVVGTLLLEAGDNLEDRNLRVDGQRWLTFQNKNMNWGYQTVPQEYCNNSELDYSRGRGVGGSSAINFGVYSLGARDDYDKWAKIVGDDAFNWDHIHARFKELETFHGEVPAGVDKKYAVPKAADHGTTGPLHVGNAAEWEKDLVPTLDIFEQAGFPLNPDHNSGNPIGMSVLINSAHKGLRSTAKDLLQRQAQNLTIMANSPVQRLLIEDKKAVGVVANGTRCWFKIDGLTQTKEFEDLPSEEQEYLQEVTVPHFEIFTHFPIHWPVARLHCNLRIQTSLCAWIQNSSPTPLIVVLQLISLRDAFRIAKHPAYIKDKLAELAAPKSNSDEDLLEYWKQNISSSWHIICTAKMGKARDADAVVDCDYRVMGIDGLRVADMRVIPVLVSGHIQAAEYVTGDACAEKLIKEYNLA